MARPSQSLGRRSKIALVQETTALTLEAHAAGDFIRTLGANLSTPRPKVLTGDSDKGVAANAQVRTGIESQLGFSALVRPAGSVGGAAELDPVFKGALGASSTPGATTENGAATSTTTALELTSASAYTAGDILWLATTGEAVQIESISTNTVTPTIPMSTAPTDSEVVNSGKQFTPANDLPTFSGYLDDDHVQRAVAGMILNGVTLDFAPNELVKITVDAPGCGKRSFAGTSTISGAYSGGESSITLASGEGVRFSVDGGSIKVTVDPGGANEETVTVTSISGDTLTISGTLANSHSDGDEIGFYSVTPTHTGTPLSGVHGSAIIDINHNGVQTRLALPLRSCSVKETNGYVWSRDYGSDHRNVYERESDNPREVMWSPTVRLTQEAISLLGLADGDVTGSILVWAGNTAGDILAVGSRKVEWSIPEFSASPTSLSTIKIDGRALESSDGGADEIRIATL